MAGRIEDYAIIGDTRTAALVGRDGAIDWLCLPRFDSGAVFAALLGDDSHGSWRLDPTDEVVAVERRYRGDSLILETELATHSGRIRIVDFMTPAPGRQALVRLVEGLQGAVPVHMSLRLRFDYGHTIPWVKAVPGGVTAVAGPHAIRLRTPVPLRGEDLATVADLEVRQGDLVPFVLSSYHPAEEPPPLVDAQDALADCQRYWADWTGTCSYEGPYRDAVVRSLLTLKALTYGPTGGVVAAATTSLPEQVGGPRNWDYRYCWLRDTTFTLYAFSVAGHEDEAASWRDWLLRAAAGAPSQLQIMYGVDGERRLVESTIDWLPGYERSAPVRVGNAASGQFQLDVYGEVMDAFHLARKAGLPPDADAWDLQCELVEFVVEHWRDPDDGIWEVRGGRQHFTYSKVMAWVALDRAAKGVERYGLAGDGERWRRVADQIHADVCQHGYDAGIGAFVQSYGSTTLDASVLAIPLVGFLPPDDPRVVSTVDVLSDALVQDGFVQRYRTDTTDDGLSGSEGTFLICSFWLVDNLALQGRHDEARALLERLLALRNDVGLLSEEYDPRAGRMLGNIPQAFSHVGLINAAHNLRAGGGPAHDRAEVRVPVTAHGTPDAPDSHDAPDKHDEPDEQDAPDGHDESGPADAPPDRDTVAT